MWGIHPSHLSSRIPSLAGGLLALVLAQGVSAQLIITSATFSVNDASDSSAVGFNFQNTTTSINTFVADGVTYEVGDTAQSAYARRSGTGASPDQSSVWYRSGSDYLGTYSSEYGQLLLGNDVNRGSDNTFSNDSGPAGGDIERLDFVWNDGIIAGNDFAVAVFDRGAANAHDAFKVSLITGWDAINEVVTSYSVLIGQTGNWAGGVNVTQGSDVPATFNYTLFRYNTGNDLTTPYDDEAGTNQGVGGIVFDLDAFGIAAGTTIYGYSLFGYDVDDGGDTANLLDWTNSTYYPTDTTGATGTGGIDLAAINGIAFSAVPEPSTYGLAAFAALAGGSCLRRRRRA